MERVLSLLDEAIKIEKKGAAFYKGVISTTSNRLAKASSWSSPTTS